MKKMCLLVVALLVCAVVGAQQTVVPIRADVNGDDVVDVADIGAVVSVMSGSLEYQYSKADVNGDGTVNVADLAAIVDVMAAGGIYADRSPQGVEAIDLALPSGTLWANMNVGAESPEGYGRYFAWGETVGFTADPDIARDFYWQTYKWMTKGRYSSDGINKYQMDDGLTDGCWYDADGFFIGDGESVLALEDDAAYVHWGGRWQMPSNADIRELVKYTTSEWVTQNGVSGRVFTSKANGRKIFLPAAGLRNEDFLLGDELGGIYWTVTLISTRRARTLCFYTDEVAVKHNARYNGITIRPVMKTK